MFEQATADWLLLVTAVRGSACPAGVIPLARGRLPCPRALLPKFGVCRMPPGQSAAQAGDASTPTKIMAKNNEVSFIPVSSDYRPMGAHPNVAPGFYFLETRMGAGRYRQASTDPRIWERSRAIACVVQ